MKTIWNFLTIILLIATLGAAGWFGIAYSNPKQVIPSQYLPASLPKPVILPTATATLVQLPPTWTKAAMLPTHTQAATETPVKAATLPPTATSTIYVLPSYTSTATATNTATLTLTPSSTTTATRTATSLATAEYPTKTQTSTKTKTPAPTKTPCAPGVCGILAVNDEVYSDIYPSSVTANLTANDILLGNPVRIVGLENCAYDCMQDTKKQYTTKEGAKVRIISDSSITYYPAEGFVGLDSIGYKIQTDGGSTSHGTVTFYVTDGSQVAPEDIYSDPDPLIVEENKIIGTTIGTFYATDANGGTMNFSLVSGTGSTDNALFGLSSAGLLKNAAVLNCESKATYSIRVRVKDSTNFSREEVFTIDAVNVNEFTPAITSGSTTSGVEGDAFTYNVTSSDADCDTTRTVTLSGTLPDGLTFSATAGAGTATISGTPAGGSAGSYPVTLRVTDDGGLYSEKVLTITIAAPTPPPP